LRKHARSTAHCWHAVKEALVAAGAIKSRPKTADAHEAGAELVRRFGFKRLPVRDPYTAPVGAVLVYSHGRNPGHVEIRTKNGFVSDYFSKVHSGYRLTGVYGRRERGHGIDVDQRLAAR